MKEHKQALRTALIVCGAVLAVTVLLVALFFGTSKQEERPTITLPETPVIQAPEDPPVQVDQNQFAEITRGNVQDVLRSLTRPSSYHQAVTIMTYAAQASRQQQVDIWRSGRLFRADITEQSGSVKSVLSDGETAYIWYDGDETALELPLRDGVSPEQLVGIGSYDTILALPQQQIISADFVTLQEEASFSCIYVTFSLNGCEQYDWIDLSSGLLCRQSIQQDGKSLYIMQQNRLDVLMDGDEALSDAFCLPDGTEPFDR